MKKYLKPEIELNTVITENIAASSGLEGWLNGGSAAYEGVEIVTYDFAS